MSNTTKDWLLAVLPSAGVVVGAALGFFAEWARERRAENRRRNERRADLRLGLLHDLRAALIHLARAVREINYHSTDSWEAGQPWQEAVNDTEWKKRLEAANDAALQATLFAAEIKDDELTAAMNTIWETGYHPFMKAPTSAAEQAAFDAFLSGLSKLSERIGQMREALTQQP